MLPYSQSLIGIIVPPALNKVPNLLYRVLMYGALNLYRVCKGYKGYLFKGPNQGTM